MACTCGCVAITTLVLGVLLAIGCGVGIPLLTTFLSGVVDQRVELLPNTTGYNNWLHPGGPIYMQFYIFNIVNPLEIEQGQRPAVEQIGPFTYREHRIKTDVVFYTNGTASYNEKKIFIFLPDRSIDSDNFTFTTINVPLLTTLEIMRKDNISENLKKLFFNFISNLHNEGLFIKRSVRQMIWGYDDDIFDFLRDISALLPNPVKIPKVFGLQQNASSAGIFDVYTGKDDPKNLGKIARWNGESHLHWWKDKYANMINGTDAVQFHPHLTRKEMLYLFNNDVCRSLYSIYHSDVKLKGINLYRYTIPGKVFLNSSANPDNAGFCEPCLASGLLSLSSCKQGAPVAISSPHFLYGDPQLVHNVTGLHPNLEEHATWIDIDPITGFTMHARKRLQINAVVSPDNSLKGMKNVKYVVMPIVYLNESAEIDKKHVDLYNQQLTIPFLIFHILEYAVPAFSGILILVSAVVLFRIKRHGRILHVQRSDYEPIE
ncbi:Lysosome membrane protein 2 [Trichoplax sp. H2]|nr:Lysosome membrane protein 2 [Trichoplax sp. H2]|eukprot:RDD38938.1 Lysosome membrane protein 2 [Trichoplax sp. H2]